jgi:hypothetical protein
MTLLVQFVQVPHLDYRIYPRFIFLLEFCIKNITIQEYKKNHHAVHMAVVLFVLQFWKYQSMHTKSKRTD